MEKETVIHVLCECVCRMLHLVTDLLLNLGCAFYYYPLPFATFLIPIHLNISRQRFLVILHIVFLFMSSPNQKKNVLSELMSVIVCRTLSINFITNIFSLFLVIHYLLLTILIFISSLQRFF